MALRAAGIFVVASAGNDGPSCGSLNTPIALYDPTFSIGAVDEFGTLTSFSSRGPLPSGAAYPNPDLIAPGFDVLSAMPGGGYDRMSGTSMAGPHVAGVVALLWSANPELIADIDTTEQILYQTAQPYHGPLTDCPGSARIPVLQPAMDSWMLTQPFRQLWNCRPHNIWGMGVRMPPIRDIYTVAAYI